MKRIALVLASLMLFPACARSVANTPGPGAAQPVVSSNRTDQPDEESSQRGVPKWVWWTTAGAVAAAAVVAVFVGVIMPRLGDAVAKAAVHCVGSSAPECQHDNQNGGSGSGGSVVPIAVSSTR